MSPSAIVAAGTRKASLTRDKVIQSILRWNALYGEPPCTADWNPSLARWRAQEWRIERYYAGDPQTGEPWQSPISSRIVSHGSNIGRVRAGHCHRRRLRHARTQYDGNDRPGLGGDPRRPQRRVLRGRPPLADRKVRRAAQKHKYSGPRERSSHRAASPGSEV